MLVEFQHSGEIWGDFPELVAGAVFADGITPDAAVGDRVAVKFTAICAFPGWQTPPRVSSPEIRLAERFLQDGTQADAVPVRE